MLNGLAKYKDFGLLLMRLGLGAMMVMHGWPKLSGGAAKWEKIGAAMQNLGISQFPVFWGFMASVTEVGGGLLMMLGFLFRPSMALLLFTMIVAALSHLSKDPNIMGASHSIELAFVFLGLLFAGAGKYSIDKK